jgi:hypothetical protein
VNKQINDIFKAADCRYLNKQEQQVLRDQVALLDGRLKAMDELASKEASIVDRTMKEVLRAYPDFKEKYSHGAESGTRDLTFVLRYAAHAMLRNDPQYFDDALLSWLKTILRGVGLRQAFIADVYRALERFATEELSPSTAAVIKPFIAHAGATLSAQGTPAPAAANGVAAQPN